MKYLPRTSLYLTLVGLSVTALPGCSQDSTEGPVAQGALASTLTVNEDGTDPAVADAVADAPTLTRSCDGSMLADHVRSQFDDTSTSTDDPGEHMGHYQRPWSGDGKGHELGEGGASFADHEDMPHHEDGADGLGGAHDGGDADGAKSLRGRRMGGIAPAYDGNADGMLDASEQAALGADLKHRCESKLARADHDGDGTLDDAEWEAEKEKISSAFKEEHARVLAEFDANADGSLDAVEAAAAHAAIEEKLAGSQAAEFSASDDNGDGSLDAAEEADLHAAIRAHVRGEG